MFTLSTSAPTLAAIFDRTGILLPIAGLSIIVLAVIYNDRTPFTKGRRPGVYYPPHALPLLGHTVEVIKKGFARELDMSLENSKQSKVGGWHMNVAGQGSIISLSRPKYIEAIQKTYFENFEKGGFTRDRFADVLGHTGIFVADGHTWKHARKTASQIFSAGQFRNWVQVVVHDELDKAVSLLNAVTSKDRSSSSAKNTQGVITLPELFFRYTLNSFSRMAFSTDIGCLTNDPVCLDTPVPFAVAFDYAQLIINDRILTPFFQVVEFFHPKGKK
ncbi:hypothetical protein A4X09_0g1029 [Tilletia walkeri]|uniref:Cytochrome P450 n=1 Tax=Tilletia walkeri TaxID=117179 RepID=A0A8X7NDS1_9BASI|nr:hypothetical protein A4X09_0g1029 [Tilletia walkeri]